MNDAYIVAGARTPIGRYGGALAMHRSDDLAAIALGDLVADGALGRKSGRGFYSWDVERPSDNSHKENSNG